MGEAGVFGAATPKIESTKPILISKQKFKNALTKMSTSPESRYEV